MKIERPLLLTALLVCLIPLLFWLVTFWTPSLSNKNQDWASFGDYIGGVISPLLSFLGFVGLLLTIRFQRTAANDQRYADHAIASLERAYATLNDGTGEPIRNRIAWLTCARLLLSAKDVSSKISSYSDGARALYAGEEEHWRHKFYLLLKPTSVQGVGASATYFAAEQIEERSIRVVFDFTAWPNGMADPIDKIPLYDALDLKDMKVGMAGVRTYVAAMQRFH